MKRRISLPIPFHCLLSPQHLTYSTGSRKVHWLNQASAVELLWPTSTNTLWVTVSNNTVIFCVTTLAPDLQHYWGWGNSALNKSCYFFFLWLSEKTVPVAIKNWRYKLHRNSGVRIQWLKSRSVANSQVLSKVLI